jgi:hypothetical protein
VRAQRHAGMERYEFRVPLMGMPNALGANQLPFLQALSSLGDAGRNWAVSIILRRARETSLTPPRAINPSRVLAALRRHGLVEGYYGHYRLATAGVEKCQES